MFAAAALVFVAYIAYYQQLYMDRVTRLDEEAYRMIATVEEHVASVPCIYGTSDVYVGVSYYDRYYSLVLSVRNDKCSSLSLEARDVLLMRTSDGEVLPFFCLREDEVEDWIEDELEDDDTQVMPWHNVEGFSCGIFYRAGMKSDGKVKVAEDAEDVGSCRIRVEDMDKMCGGLSHVRIETSHFPIDLSGEDAARFSETIKRHYELIARTASEKKSLYDGFREDNVKAESPVQFSDPLYKR